jgi:hypothetical protein
MNRLRKIPNPLLLLKRVFELGMNLVDLCGSILIVKFFRDWIANMAAIRLIHELVENTSEYESLLRNVEWIIIPSINPDGFEYTHTTVSLICSCSRYKFDINLFFQRIVIGLKTVE